MMGQVEGKVAIVTGGASGIGAACAATLAREGAKVVITDIDDAGAQAVVGRIVSAGGEAICLHQDVSIEQEWPGVIEATERRFGPLNVMMANAGIGILCKAIEMSLADWRRQTAINLDGVFLSAKYGVPAMRRARGGSIIITSSVAGLRGSAGLAGYCATKGGVRLFAKAVAMECAAEGDGIRINTVHPGSSIRRSGQRSRVRRAATHRSTRTKCPNRGFRSAGSGRRRTSPTASCFWPQTRRAT
jgi:NAD(P)-dependent dehydrogenase (short-subunit alcohol dehydrogenase family)